MKKTLKYIYVFMCICLLIYSMSIHVLAIEETVQINNTEGEISVSPEGNTTEESGENEAEETEAEGMTKTDTEDKEEKTSEGDNAEQTKAEQTEEIEVGSPDTYWLILDGYNVSSERLISGEDSVVSLNIKNTNTKKNATNVMVSIISKDYSILPKLGLSNQFFVDTIPAKESKTVKIPISVAEGVVGNNDLRITIDYTYTNENGENNFTNEMTIVLPVYLSSVVTEKLTLISNGDELKVDYKNTGSKNVYNVTAHVSGDLSGTENFFMGNIASGEIGTANIPVTFLGGGNKNIKIFYSYTNDRGVSIQSDVESFLVSAIRTLDTKKGDADSEIKGNSVSMSLVAILVICLAAIIVSVVYGRTDRKVN